MRLVPTNFSVSVPWLGSVSVDLSEEAERAAWALYVELCTRIATKPLEQGEGSIREALGSLHNLFGITRDVLKSGGLDVARARHGKQSLASIATGFLNDVLRPRLVKWHTGLSAYEADVWKGLLEQGGNLPNNPSLALALVDERGWEGYETFYAELAELQDQLNDYVEILGAMCGATASELVTRSAEA
jgi:hypothetical protein